MAMTARAGAPTTPVTVIGAGPYGLAAAAHLRGAGIPARVLGEPMDTWRAHMPAGMYLKSTPSASSISAPRAAWGLAAFRAFEGRPPGDDLHPVPGGEFTRYGTWFAEQCVPDVERVEVTGVALDGRGFRLTSADGEEFTSRAVVLATGQTAYAYLPEVLAGPRDAGRASHTADHADLSGFAGQRVAVLGAGQSALESAALLREAGAYPTVVARAPRLLFGTPPADGDPRARPMAERLVKPASPLGPGWSLRSVSGAPGAYRHLPDRARARLLRTVLGPSGAWWLRERVDGVVPVLLGRAVRAADDTPDGVRLRLRGPDGSTEVLDVDHVLAATGYHVDVDRLTLLDESLRRAVRRIGRAPRLTGDFESSVPGLYFTGLAAAATFGPVLRFVCGTGFAARRIGAGVATRLRR
ncbi:FAD-dependent oxidoreductase [Streptantibioticus parmotrematis]|nr:NAD(P)-binding domain-containing protein [Streptantibioticus parmotrematis]